MSNNTFALAVQTENANWGEVGSKYDTAALEIETLLSDGINPHTYLCYAQDLAAHPESWNRSINGLKKALKPRGILITKTRDYRLTHRSSSPLFVVRLKSEVDAEKRINAEAEKAEAERLERLAVLAKQEAERLADSMVTFESMARTALDECYRLGIDPYAVASQLVAYADANAAEEKIKA